ncbi:MAG: FIST C-terminal domain-containing protein [Proteobacteria bacterium]|nr:FIST C-terminal domain-containing protein [Pseudomonadota bacterium]
MSISSTLCWPRSASPAAAELLLATLERTEVIALPIGRHRDLEDEGGLEHLPTSAATLVHGLMEAASSDPWQLFSGIVGDVRGVEQLVRQAVAVGDSPHELARSIAAQLAAPDLRIVFVFADWQLDAPELAHALHRALAPARIVGGTSIGLIGPARAPGLAVVALGLYGDWLRVGVGTARDLTSSALTRSREAMATAAAELGTTLELLVPQRHVGVTFVDGTSGHGEVFCIGSAAAAPQIRMVGSGMSAELSTLATPHKPYVFVDGAALQDTAVVALLDSALRMHPLRSSHMVATAARVVVTGSTGRMIHELDGKPALSRLREIARQLANDDDPELRSTSYAFARIIDGIPYVRSVMAFVGEQIQIASAVEVGHVLRVMQPGDLIGTTRKDLAAAVAAVGGTLAALLVFSCIGRHWEAAASGLDDELARAYATHGALGCQSFGEQSGMLLVNHTLTGLAIGMP